MKLIPPWEEFGQTDFILVFNRRTTPIDRVVNLKNNWQMVRYGRPCRVCKKLPEARIVKSQRYKEFEKWAIPELERYAIPWREIYGVKASSQSEMVMVVAYRPPMDGHKRPDRDGVQTTIMDLLQHAGVYKDDAQVVPRGSFTVEPVEDLPARLWVWLRPIQRILGPGLGPVYEVIERTI